MGGVSGRRRGRGRGREKENEKLCSVFILISSKKYQYPNYTSRIEIFHLDISDPNGKYNM